MAKDVMKLAQWLKLTDGGLLQTRSAALKAVDTALQRYEASSNLHNWDDLQKAVIRYLGTKGANWKTDKRNRFGALTTLYEQVMGIQGPGKTAGSMVGLSHVRDESRAILETLFLGKQLEWRPGILAKLDIKTKMEKSVGSATAKGFVKDIKTVSGAAHMSGGSAAATSNAVSRILRESVPAEMLHDVSGFLAQHMPHFLSELSATCAPISGILTSGASVAVGIGQTIKTEYQRYDTQEMQKRSMALGTGEAAIRGMVQILERECNRIEADLAINSAALVTKVGLFFADAGTVSTAATGLASQLTKLLLVVQRLVRDIREKNAVRTLLMSPRSLDISVFETSPVLGAYLVACAPTSVMVDSVFSRFYQRGWMGDVEHYVANDLQTLKERARTLVHGHRFWIPSLQKFPGLMEVNTKELERMKANVGKSGMVGFGSDTPITQLPQDMQQAMLRDANRGIKPPPLPPRPRRG